MCDGWWPAALYELLHLVRSHSPAKWRLHPVVYGGKVGDGEQAARLVS